MSHCYFPVAFLPQAPVPFLHVADFKDVRRGWDLRDTQYGLYYELRLLERELTSAASTKDDKDFIERFDQLEDRASHLWVPASLRPRLYELRSHIRLVGAKATSS